MTPIKINLKPISRLNVFELPIILHNFQCKGQAGLPTEANLFASTIHFYVYSIKVIITMSLIKAQSNLVKQIYISTIDEDASEILSVI
jgi:hypothetical protein